MSLHIDMKNLKELRILIVDDDDDGRHILCDYIKQYVKEVYDANCTEKAISIIKSKKPDLVVTDIIMPGKDGIELAKTLKKISGHTPFIFITASKERDTLFKVIDSRPNCFLTKPIEPKALLKAISECAFEVTKPQSSKIMLKCGAIFNPKDRTITYKDKTEKLTNKEFEFLKLLVESKGSILSYELIEKKIWVDFGERMTEGALKNIIYRIRQKSGKECLTTLSNIGVKE